MSGKNERGQDVCPKCSQTLFGLPSVTVCDACGWTSLEDDSPEQCVQRVNEDERNQSYSGLMRFHIG